jgi:hypothetical protein
MLNGIIPDNLIGLVMVVVSAALIALFTFPRRSRKARPLRNMPAFSQLQRALGLAVEQGKRLHLSLGRASILSSSSASALVGLSTLERVAQVSIISDQPPVATSGDGSLALLSQDTLRAAYRITNASDQYEADRGRLTGPTPFSYAAGALPVIRSEDAAANILIGNFGPEVALMIDTADRQKAFIMAASDSLPAQAVMYATAEETLIGEELFAIPAYMQAGPVYQASLRVQDIFRWVIVAALVIGTILKLISLLTGMPIL